MNQTPPRARTTTDRLHRKPKKTKNAKTKPKSAQATERKTPATEKTNLHPRNKHRGRYDFTQLTLTSPQLQPYVLLNPYQETSIDFANANSVKALNQALLKHFYGISNWDIPAQYLCPPIPGRADYIHYLADLLVSHNPRRTITNIATPTPTDTLENTAIATDTAANADISAGTEHATVTAPKTIRVLDIGVGANAIYPIIGNREYGWEFVGSDIDPEALRNAQHIIDNNSELTGAITLRLQADPMQIFKGVIQANEHYDLTLCNPPFHQSQEEVEENNQRKWESLRQHADPERQQRHPAPHTVALNFGGQAHELYCPGGEVAFIERMIKESRNYAHQCTWFTTIVSRGAHLSEIQSLLKRVRVKRLQTIEMAQGQKKTRFVAWGF